MKFDANIDDLVPMQDMRFHRDAVKDEELLKSITEWGIRDDLTVRPHPDPELKEQGKFEIVDGRRRFRLAKIAGQTKIPVDCRDMDDEEAYTMAIVKNMQRSDVSDVAMANWLNLMQIKFEWTQETLASKVGKSQSWVSRMLRLWKQASAPKTEGSQTVLPMTERQARGLSKMPDDMKERIIGESVQLGKVPYSGRDLERKAQAKATADEVLARYPKNTDDEFLVHQLVEEAGLTMTDAKTKVTRWKLRLDEKRRRPPSVGYKPRSDNKEVQLFKKLAKYYPYEIIDEVAKIFGHPKILETWLKNCRRYISKLFQAAPEQLRQSVLEEFKL